MANIPTQKDADQVLRYAFDDATNAIRVDATILPGPPVPIDHTSDSIAIGTSTQLFTATDVGPSVALDTNVVQSVLPSGAATEATLSSLNSKFISTTATVTSVSSSTSNQTLLASNAGRKGAVLNNNSTQICYMKFGTTATNVDFTVAMAPQSVFIIDSNAIYLGRIDAVWVSANGNMAVTELT